MVHKKCLLLFLATDCISMATLLIPSVMFNFAKWQRVPSFGQILSRGRIIKAGNMNTDTLTFPVLPKMGPEFKLLVYYIKESGEVVSDSRIFKVDKCFPNTVCDDGNL